MTKVNIYLTFDGNCKQAFNFYKSVFGTEFTDLNTFNEMPLQKNLPSVTDDMKEKIMHVSLPISKDTILMGSDSGGGEWARDLVPGNNISISISVDSREKADQFFHSLSAGGTTKIPMAKTFWGEYFGMLTDKFGINWMVSCRDAKS